MEPNQHFRSRVKLLPPININNQSLSSPVYAAAMQDHFARSYSIRSTSQNVRSTSYKPILNPQKRQLAKWNSEIKRKQAIINGKHHFRNCPESRSIKELESGKEILLDPVLKPLTLAQKLGIVSRPKDRLTEPEWTRVKNQSKERCTEKCPICCEPFTKEEQILLSCSHVYHRFCLESYEKHVFKKSCPICRTQDYEKRLSFEGQRNFYNKSAIKIQKTFRMWRIRKKYLLHLETVPPSDPRLRRKYFLQKLSKISCDAECMVAQDTLEINEFLRDLDQDLIKSRQILKLGTVEFEKFNSIDFDWDLIYQKATDRLNSCIESCSICISPLRNDHRSLTLLNCSHVFHDNCISTFESFVLDGPHTCPVCRCSNYSRINFE